MAETIPQIDLSDHERQVLEHLSAKKGKFGKRAVALLALAEGSRQQDVATRVGVSGRTVRRWKTEFKESGLRNFPAEVLDHPQRQKNARKKIAAGDPRSTMEHQGIEDHGGSEKKLTGLDPDDTMVQAAKKILSFHFERMLAHEAGTIAGEDIEELHDMRVATRRMRSAFRLFGEFLAPVHARPVFRGMKRTGRALGPVRDLDVFWQKTKSYVKNHAELREEDLDLARLAWKDQHAQARKQMIRYLNSKKFRRFKKDFRFFLNLPEDQLAVSDPLEVEPNLIKHVIPTLIVQKLMHVLAFGRFVQDKRSPYPLLHDLRIAGKRLRYALEFFSEVLSPQAVDLIAQLKRIQDQLGDLQDAVVACEWLNDLLESEFQKTSAHVPNARGQRQILGLRSYLRIRENERDRLRDGFLEVWAEFNQHAFIRAFQRAMGLP